MQTRHDDAYHDLELGREQARRNDVYQDLELGREEEESKVTNSDPQQNSLNSPPLSPTLSSTRSTMQALGFYPELSLKKKSLLFLCALLAAYETYEPVQRGGNDFLGLMTTPTDTTHIISKGFAGLISLIIMIATLRSMGKGLRNLERYSDRINAHGQKIKELERGFKAQQEEIQQLQEEVEESEMRSEQTNASILLGTPGEDEEGYDDKNEAGRAPQPN